MCPIGTDVPCSVHLPVRLSVCVSVCLSVCGAGHGGKSCDNGLTDRVAVSESQTTIYSTWVRARVLLPTERDTFGGHTGLAGGR